MVFPSLSEFSFDTQITYAIVSGILIALFYFYGRMYYVATEKEQIKENYIITGLHFFVLFIIMPLVIFLTDIPDWFPSFYSGAIHTVNNFLTLHRGIAISTQFGFVIILEQIAQKTKLMDFICPKKGCIETSCKKLQRNCLFKYLIILFVIPFDYPSFFLGSKLSISSNLSDFRFFFISTAIVLLGLAYLAMSLGNFQKYVEVAENTTLMRTLHDAWNDKDWHKFEKLHSKNTAVYWPDETEKISGRMENSKKAKRFFHKFSENHIENREYKVLFSQGDWTCSVATFKGIMKGTMMVNETKIGPTNKPFEVELCTVAQWKDGEIVKERLFMTLLDCLGRRSLI